MTRLFHTFCHVTVASTSKQEERWHNAGAVFDLLHNGLSSGQSCQLPVMFNHLVLAASRWTDKAFNELPIKSYTF